MKDLCTFWQILGMEVAHSQRALFVSKKLTDLMKEYDTLGSKPVEAPTDTTI